MADIKKINSYIQYIDRDIASIKNLLLSLKSPLQIQIPIERNEPPILSLTIEDGKEKKYPAQYFLFFICKDREKYKIFLGENFVHDLISEFIPNWSDEKDSILRYPDICGSFLFDKYCSILNVIWPSAYLDSASVVDDISTEINISFLSGEIRYNDHIYTIGILPLIVSKETIDKLSILPKYYSDSKIYEICTASFFLNLPSAKVKKIEQGAILGLDTIYENKVALTLITYHGEKIKIMIPINNSKK